MHGQDIEVPGCMTEKAVEAAPMPIVQIAAGEDDVCNIAVSVGQNPAGGHWQERLKSWRSEYGSQVL
jgi:hypothetical protein